MKCAQVRDGLVRERLIDGVRNDDLERHLQECEACTRFAERAHRAEEILRGHHTDATPDPSFAARVVARLPEKTPDLGWAAVRLLPATAALLLVLTAWAWLGTSSPSDLVASSPTDDLVSWVLTNGEVDE